jgi:NAD(P)-dependent dehydrogenase (short-subunit alcohol dehydrogenase family)
MAGQLDGRVAIVTGAGRGIGQAVARAFGAEGAAVVCADINAGRAEETAERLRAEGGRALALAVDVSDEASTLEMARRAAEAFGFDPDRVDTAPPPVEAIPAGGAPFDTRLDNRATAAALDVEPLDLDGTFAKMAVA